jgi:hypothetical protein
MKTYSIRFLLCLVWGITACDGGGGANDPPSVDAPPDDDDDDPPAMCNNGICEAGEDSMSCSADCSTCGDGTCQSEETSVTCPADCQPVCGDGVCEVGETISTCSEDCASASCTVGDPNSCSGETICIAGTCENAFGRNYRITVVRGVITERNKDGNAWDIGGGLPDPVVTLTINGAMHTTPVINDTLEPSWNFVTPPTLIPGGTVFQIDVADSDIAADDMIIGCLNNPLTANLLRAGARCSGSGPLAGAHVDVKFTPN